MYPDLSNKVYLLRQAEIAYLKVNKACIKVPSKYADFEKVFSSKLAANFSKYIKINNHAIELVGDQQPSYNRIYNLSLIELERLKIYIKNNLANSFIRSFKFPTGTLIVFDKKPDKNLRLYVNYQELKNLII